MTFGIHKKLKPGQLFTVNRHVYRVRKQQLKHVGPCYTCPVIYNNALCAFCKKRLPLNCYPTSPNNRA